MRVKVSMGRKLALVLAFTLMANALLPAFVDAGALSNTYLRLNRMKAATGSSFQLVFTTSAGTATEDNITVDFSSAWSTNSGSVNATQTVSSATCAAATGATALPAAATLTLAASGATTVVTITNVGNLAASTAYCVDLTSTTAVTLPTAGEYRPVIATKTGSTIVDNATVSVRVVSDDSITVTAKVPPTFNFQLDSNVTAFTTDLAPGSKTQTTARTVTVSTNAKTGWVAWLRNSDTTGLYSAGVNKDIAPTTPGTAVNVDANLTTEQYVWGVSSLTQTAGVGTLAIDPAYDASGLTNDGSGVDNAYRKVASSNGTADNAVVTLLSSATISNITPASSDYTDIIQVIGAGNF